MKKEALIDFCKYRVETNQDEDGMFQRVLKETKAGENIDENFKIFFPDEVV